MAYSELLDELFAKIHEARPDLYVLNPSSDLITEVRYESLMGGWLIPRDGSSDKFVVDTDTEEWNLAISLTV